ncbi:calcineurin-like phosphoesterase C-terminal domain-containing protein [Tabrizicola sp.]|uniref:calcineurin-like phosphoesterase C-terminal domain-containing protein n=1 Tax=Tabrizicola sp. TaxID=2005166 RepID=UPI003F363AC0
MTYCHVPALALLLGSGLAFAVPAVGHSYVADIHTVPATAGQTADMARGAVFHDLSRDGVRQEDEPGIGGVIVSNGRDAVKTGPDGAYELPVFDNMTVMVVKPADYDTPVNADGVPQFSYVHKPAGTPQKFRYGGIAPTGPLPVEINFPLLRRPVGEEFSCVAMGDTQPYSNTEVGYVRDSVLDSILRQDYQGVECQLLLGDVMGDDLGLLPRFMDIMSVTGFPQYYIHGNHDYDFDALSDADSADSWRTLYGPNYYAFEIGKVFFVALDNVVFPCTAAEAKPGDRERCGSTEGNPIYNGRVTDEQMEWLRNVMALVPEDRLIVFMHHIPFVSHIDSNTGRHQTDNVNDIYALVGGRPALSLSGHTHTLEFLAAGESFKGWKEQVNVTRIPFDHLVAGAPSGNWFFGDMSFDGTPMAFSRGGTPPGYVVIDFDGTGYQITFHAANQDPDRQMALSFNTPAFREWFTAIYTWQEAQEEETADPAALPPKTLNDLADVKLFTPEEIGQDVWLTANVWLGERNTEVYAQINDGPRMPMERTQAGNGEDVLKGAEYADPFAVQRQMTVGRYAWQSASGDPRTQGFEIWQGEHFGPVAPRAAEAWMIADSSSHLWRMRMPEDLPEGAHVITVTKVDRWGREWQDEIVFEVRGEKPPPFWRSELWPSQ